MKKPITENLDALARGHKLNPYQLMLASNEAAFTQKYIVHLEVRLKNLSLIQGGVDLFLNIDQDGDVLSIHKTEEGAINRRIEMLEGGVPAVQCCIASLEN